MSKEMARKELKRSLGKVFSERKTSQKNFIKSSYQLLLMNQNAPNSQLSLGIQYIFDNQNGHDIEKEIQYLTLSVDKYNNYSQLLLGILYFKGKYVPENVDKTIHYLKLSADKKDPEAQYYLALIYLN